MKRAPKVAKPALYCVRRRGEEIYFDTVSGIVADVVEVEIMGFHRSVAVTRAGERVPVQNWCLAAGQLWTAMKADGRAPA